MRTHRLFVALDLPPEIHATAVEVQAALRKRWPDLRYTAPENLHLTLKFLGQVEASRVEEVASLLGTIEPAPTQLRLAEAGFFSPRIVWIAVEGADDLQRQVDAALKGLFPPEHRFMGHITIARSKRLPSALSLDLETLVVPKIEAGFLSFSLQESHLSHQGPRYEARAQY